MHNKARKQARSVVIGHSVLQDGEWVAVTGTRHDYSYNNPSRRKTVATVTLRLANGNAIQSSGQAKIAVGW